MQSKQETWGGEKTHGPLPPRYCRSHCCAHLSAAALGQNPCSTLVLWWPKHGAKQTRSRGLPGHPGDTGGCLGSAPLAGSSKGQMISLPWASVLFRAPSSCPFSWVPALGGPGHCRAPVCIHPKEEGPRSDCPWLRRALHTSCNSAGLGSHDQSGETPRLTDATQSPRGGRAVIILSVSTSLQTGDGREVPSGSQKGFVPPTQCFKSIFN